MLNLSYFGAEWNPEYFSAYRELEFLETLSIPTLNIHPIIVIIIIHFFQL
jgi:hypothetical protein